MGSLFQRAIAKFVLAMSVAFLFGMLTLNGLGVTTPLAQAAQLRSLVELRPVSTGRVQSAAPQLTLAPASEVLPDAGLGNPPGSNDRRTRNMAAAQVVNTGNPLSLISGTLSQDWGDFDRDGYLDLALGSTSGISIYHNISGQLSIPEWSLPGGPAYGVRWADLNRDGRLELVAVGGITTTNGFVRNPIYRFDGIGFTQTSVFTSPYPLARVVVLSGTADLIASTSAISVPCPVLRFRNTNGQFTQPPVCVSTAATAAIGVADVDRDGDSDLVLGRFPNSVVLLKNLGGSVVLTETGFIPFDTAPFWPYDFAWGDYDGDGYLDLAAAFPLLRQVRVYHNEGLNVNPPFKLASVIATQRVMTPLAIDWGDFNGDGALDLAVADDPPKVVFNVNQSIGSGSNALVESQDPSHQTMWSARAVALGNSDLSLALSVEQGPSLVYQSAAGHLQPQISPITGAIAANSVAWGDANGDGQMDLVMGTITTTAPARSTVYWNGKGVFSSLDTAVFDVDGAQNIAIGNLGKRAGQLNAVLGTSTGNIRVYTLTADAPIPVANWNIGTPVNAVALGDLNNDGWLDLLTGGSNGSVYVYANVRGKLDTVPVFSGRESGQVRSVAWADYNKDLYMDFAVASDPGYVRVYQNNQDKSFTPAFTMTASVHNTAVAWGDFNGDGQLDLAVGTAEQGVSLYENKYNQLSETPVWTSGTSSHTTSLAWGDWNNDDRLDLAVGNEDGPVQVFANFGNQLGLPQFRLTWSSAEGGNTTGVAWGDVNRDGYLDLAVSRSSGLSGVYHNTSVLPWRLPNPPSYLSIARPGKTRGAYLYSSSELLPGYFDSLPLTVAPTVTVYYSAYNSAGTPITNPMFEFSLDGGSNWSTASRAISNPLSSVITQTAPQGRDGVFVWDAQMDGAISDNALFRIRVVDQLPVGPFQRAASTAVSPPFRVRGLSCLWPTGLSIDRVPKTTPVATFSDVRFIGLLAESSGDVIDYSWDFGDGVSGVVGKEVVHTYKSEGFFPVTLRATSATCPTPEPLKATMLVQVGNPSLYKLYLPLLNRSGATSTAAQLNQPLVDTVQPGRVPSSEPLNIAAPVASGSSCVSISVPALSSQTVAWITATTGYVGQPVLSRNGSQLAFWSTADLATAGTKHNSDGNIEMFYGQIDRVASCITVTQITSSTGGILEGFNLGPAINAAGDRVAFFSDRDLVSGGNPDHNLEIFLASVTSTGINVTQVTTTTDRVNAFPSLDATGTQIAFASDQDFGGIPSNADGNQEIFVATLGSSVTYTQVTDTNVGMFNDEPSIDSGGQHVAFVRGGKLAAGGIQEIFVAAVGTPAPTRVTTSATDILNYHPTIGSSGNKIAFASSTVTQSAVNLATISGSSIGIVPLSVSGPGVQAALNLDDASRIALVSNNAQVNVFNLDTNGLMPVFPCAGANCRYSAISGDGMHVAFVSNATLYMAYYETANLSITLASATTPTVAGTSVTYTFAVVNQGPSLADSVEIAGALIASPGVTLTAVSSTSAGGNCNLQGTVALVCVFPDWPRSPAAPLFITVVAEIDPVNQVPFTLRMSASAWQKVSGSGNNVLTLMPDVVTQSDLKVKKTANPAVVAGTQLTYTIAITNFGPSYARTVVLSDLLPTGTVFNAQFKVAGPAAVLTNSGNLVTDTIPVLALGESATFKVVADVITMVGGYKLQNTAIAVSEAADPTPGDNSNTSTVETAVQVAPLIVSSPVATFTVGAPGSFTVVATGYQTPTLSYSGILPAGVTFVDLGNSTAALSGTPTVGTGGVYSLVITATNIVPPQAVQHFTLIVNEAPRITSANHATFTVGTAGSFVVTTFGYPTPTLTSAPGYPSNLTFIDNGNGTATLSGVPALGTVNSYPHVITATNGTPPAAQQPFTVTIVKATPSVVVTSLQNPSVFGQAVTFSATVTSIAGTPIGSVQFSIDGVNYGSPVALTGGVATISASGLSVGSHTVIATYSGDANFNSNVSTSVTQTVNKAATTVTITDHTPSPSVAGESVTVSFTVAVNAPGGGTPLGSVTVTDGTVSCAASLPATSCSLTFTSSGTKNLTATYSGDGNFSTSTSATVAHLVKKADTTTTILSHTPNPSVVGQSVTVNFNLTINSPGGGSTSGTVTVTDGIDFCTKSVPPNSSSCNLALTTAGTRSLIAIYSGNANLNGSTSLSVTHTVNPASTTTTLTTSKNSTRFGEPITLTATVAAVAPGTGTPTGVVTFTEGATVLGTATLNASGVGQLTLASLSVGSHTITATYGSDSNFLTSFSNSVTQSVAKANTNTALTSAPNASLVGQSVTFTATVTVVAPGAGTPGNTVTFREGPTTLGSGPVDGSGHATFSTTGLLTGSHVISATYGGDTNFNNSSSGTVTQIVNAAPIVTLHPMNLTVVAGQTAIFTSTASGAPAPTVQWEESTDNGLTWHNYPGGTSTTLSFTTGTTYNGRQYRAVFTNVVGIATSNIATLTVNYAPSITLQPTNQTVIAGNSATFTAAATGNPAPTAQWQSSSNGGVTWITIGGATSPSYSFTALASNNGELYHVIFSNGISPDATSVAVTLTVNTLPAMTLEPSSLTVITGQLAVFTATASGYPTPTVQWRVSPDGGGSWSNVTGATSTTLRFTATLTQTNYRYFARFINAAGTIDSQVVTLTVNSALVRAPQQPASQLVAIPDDIGALSRRVILANRQSSELDLRRADWQPVALVRAVGTALRKPAILLMY